MKPSWKDAPEWAEYLAMDSSGQWWWYEVEPYFVSYEGLDQWISDGDSELAIVSEITCSESLEKRP